MMRSHGVIGLDIGTESIKAVALELVRGEMLPRIIGAGAALSRGMRRGDILEPAELAPAIKNAIDALEKSAGIKSGGVHVAIGGGIAFQKSKGLVAVARASEEIAREDCVRAVFASESNLSRLQNREILHKIPLIYRIDNETETRDPEGLIGTKLEAEVMFITAFSQNLRNVIKSFEEAGVEIESVVAAPQAASLAVLEKREMEAGVMLLDLGAATTSIILYEEMAPYSLEVLPLGSSHITHDIATGLRITLEEAEKLKINYGGVKQDILPTKKDLVYGNYSKKKLSEIIEARLADIFELTEKHLKKVNRAGLLPAGVVIIGGGANLPGIQSFAKEYLKLHAKVAEPDNISGFKEKVKNPAWSVAVGTSLMALQNQNSTHSFLGGQTGSLFGWLRAFLP